MFNTELSLLSAHVSASVAHKITLVFQYRYSVSACKFSVMSLLGFKFGRKFDGSFFIKEVFYKK